jgi:hypothetical protein
MDTISELDIKNIVPDTQNNNNNGYSSILNCSELLFKNKKFSGLLFIATFSILINFLG